MGECRLHALLHGPVFHVLDEGCRTAGRLDMDSERAQPGDHASIGVVFGRSAFACFDRGYAPGIALAPPFFGRTAGLLTLRLHERRTERLLGRQLVVRTAPRAEIVHGGLAAAGERDDVIELEVGARLARR